MNYLPQPAAEPSTALPAGTPVADDFPSIGARLKELQAEKERERQSRKDDPPS